MKLTIEQRALTTALKQLLGVVQSRNTIPVLANVAIIATDTAVTITATDLDIEATATVAANVTQTGAITVGAKVLSDIASKMPPGSLVAIEYDPATYKLTVKAGRASYDLATLPIEDFPRVASQDYATTFDLSGADMAALMSPAFAASDEETRYYLQGVYLHAVNGILTAVATDGHRLALAYRGDAPDNMHGVIIPRKTISIAPVGDVTVSVSETKVRFATQGLTVVSKVIDGTFPDYASIIPQSHPHSVKLDTATARLAVDRVVAVSDERTRSVALSIGDGIITLSTVGQNSATDVIDCETNGDALRIGFNGAYLSDILRQAGGIVTMAYNGAQDPAIITNAAGDVFLLMPMRV